jgi:peptide chain release factor 2
LKTSSLAWNRFVPDSKRCGGIFDVAALTEKVTALEAKAVEPGFWDNPDKARGIIDETNRYRAVLKPFDAVSTALEDAELLIELSEQEEDEAQRNQAVKDAATSLDGAEAEFEKLEMQSLLSGELDGSNAYLTLHAGAGGTESCDWAEMLLRMYRHYCDSNGFNVEILELSPGDEAGIKSATMLVSADFAFGYLKAERGVHRLVRISPFDSAKRRHTSFVALDVVAEVADDIEVEILEHNRLGGTDYARPHRNRGGLPGGAFTAQEPRQGHENVACAGIRMEARPGAQGYGKVL